MPFDQETGVGLVDPFPDLPGIFQSLCLVNARVDVFQSVLVHGPIPDIPGMDLPTFYAVAVEGNMQPLDLKQTIAVKSLVKCFKLFRRYRGSLSGRGARQGHQQKGKYHPSQIPNHNF